MSLLDDRPQCCAGLRAAAKDEVLGLDAELFRLRAEVANLRHLIRTFGLSAPEPMGDVEVRCRDWRALHLTKLGDLFDEAADEIGRLKARVAAFEDSLE